MGPTAAAIGEINFTLGVPGVEKGGFGPPAVQRLTLIIASENGLPPPEELRLHLHAQDRLGGVGLDRRKDLCESGAKLESVTTSSV